MDTLYIDNYIEEAKGGICTTTYKVNYNLGLLRRYRKLPWNKGSQPFQISYFLAGTYFCYHLFQSAYDQLILFLDLSGSEKEIKKFTDELIPAEFTQEFFSIMKEMKEGDTGDSVKLAAGIPPMVNG
ncbi:MAG: hypothetical protein QM764_22040 [Chitinophagaceae bacterium]